MFPLLLIFLGLVLAWTLTLQVARRGWAIPAFFIAIVAALLVVSPNHGATIANFQKVLTLGPALQYGTAVSIPRAKHRPTRWQDQIDKLARWFRINAALASLAILGILLLVRSPAVRVRVPEPFLNFGTFALSLVLCYTLFFAVILPLQRSGALDSALHWIAPVPTWARVGLVLLSFVVARAIAGYPVSSSVLVGGAASNSVPAADYARSEPRMSDGDPLWRMRQERETQSRDFARDLDQQMHDARAASFESSGQSYYGGDSGD
jgi:hypothetical protein